MAESDRQLHFAVPHVISLEPVVSPSIPALRRPRTAAITGPNPIASAAVGPREGGWYKRQDVDPDGSCSPVKTELSPALARSTVSPRTTTSSVRGIEPAGISDAFSYESNGMGVKRGN